MRWYATGPDDDIPTTCAPLPVAHIQARARARLWGRGAVWALDPQRVESVLVARYVRGPDGTPIPAPLTV